MNREYHKWYSDRLGRDMELLVFGHAGLPVMVFPTSGGRFYEFEDRGMIGALAGKIDAGEVQIYCVDSVDMESWYNKQVSPRWRIARQVQYDDYLIHEVVPLVRLKNHDWHLVSLGCSFGGFHAVNMALQASGCIHRISVDERRVRSAEFSAWVLRSGLSISISRMDFLPNLGDNWFLERYRRNSYVLATGWDDQCLGQNQRLDGVMNAKGIPHKLFVWDTYNSHDWPTWMRMVDQYL